MPKPWTEAEIEYLREHYGRASIKSIASKLGRTENAIMVKRQRLHLGAFLNNGDYITMNQLMKSLKLSYASKKPLLDNGLPVKNKQVKNCRFKVIKIEAFWKWCEKHKELIDFSRLEPGELGVEPEWVKIKRKADFKYKSKTSPWTSAEDSKLKLMCSLHRYHLDDIANELNRTEVAVRRRIYDLGIADRPVKHKARSWSEEEIRSLLEMRSAGMPFKLIAEKLGRSESACRGKLELLANPGYTNRITRRKREALKDCFQKNMCAHWDRAAGCDINGENCDCCEHFQRVLDQDEHKSSWNSSNSSAAAEELLRKL